MWTTYESTTYQTLKCWVCGCQFAVDRYVYDSRKARGENLRCPAGCNLALGEAVGDKLRRELDYERKCKEGERQRADRYARQAVALRGVVTRTKRRIAAGKCPCCHAKFPDLHGHMSVAHPDYGGSE